MGEAGVEAYSITLGEHWNSICTLNTRATTGLLFNNLYSILLLVFRFKVDLLSIDYFSDHYKEKIGD